MNNDPFDPLESPDPLEQRLRGLRPADLPPDLTLRLESERPRKLTWIAFAAPLAAAAVWFVAFLAWPRSETNVTLASHAISPASSIKVPTDLRVFLPVEETSTLVDVSELGVLDDVPTRPVRLMRYRWIDDTTFRGDDGRSTLRRTEPREQIIPVVLEAY